MFLSLRFPIALARTLSRCPGYAQALARSPFAANEGAKERSPLSRYCLAARSRHGVGPSCAVSAALTSLSPCIESCCAQQLSPTLPMASVPPSPMSCLLGFAVGATTIHLFSPRLSLPCCPVSLQTSSPAVQPLPSLPRPRSPASMPRPPPGAAERSHRHRLGPTPSWFPTKPHQTAHLLLGRPSPGRCPG